MVNAYRITRDVTIQECHWLDKDIPAGTILYTLKGPSYGVASESGVCLTYDNKGAYPGFEVPRNAIHMVDYFSAVESAEVCPTCERRLDQ